MLCSKLMIFIRYENNGYCFIQENIIFHFTYAIFDEGLFYRCTDSYAKECKLYDKLLDKISPETKLSVSDPSGKNRPILVSILHTSIPSIQNNSLTYSFSLLLSYKSIFPLPILGSKKPIVEIEENDNVNSDVEIQLLNP